MNIWFVVLIAACVLAVTLGVVYGGKVIGDHIKERDHSPFGMRSTDALNEAFEAIDHDRQRAMFRMTAERMRAEEILMRLLR